MIFNPAKKSFFRSRHRVGGVGHHIKHYSKKTILIFSVVFAIVLLLVGTYIWQAWLTKKATKADLVYFYPAKCLGGWTYPAHAENKPDLDFGSEASLYNNVNSATLANAMAEIYCSDFKGEGPSGTMPKALKLRLSLAVKPFVDPVEMINTATTTPEIATTTEEITTSTSDIVDDATTDPESESSDSSSEAPLDEPEPADNTAVDSQSVPEPTSEPRVDSQSVPEPSVDAPAEESSWLWEAWDNLMALLQPLTALAQTDSDEKVEQSESLPESNDEQPEMPTIETETPTEGDFVDALQDATTTIEWQDLPTSSLELETDTATSTPTSSAPIMPADALLKLSYTLNGEDWSDLGYIGESDWNNIEFVIPVGTAMNDWDDLARLQIKLERVMNINSVEPAFYLDGMSLEAEFDDLPMDMEETEDDQPDLKKDKVLKHKSTDKLIVVNVERHGSQLDEIWYTERATSTDQILNPKLWYKISVDGDLGQFKLMDVKGDFIFWVSEGDKKVLYNFNYLEGNINSIDVDPNGISVMTFDASLSDEIEAELVEDQEDAGSEPGLVTVDELNYNASERSHSFDEQNIATE